MFLHRVQLHLRRPRHILIKFNLKATTALSNVSLLLTCSGGPEGFRSAATTETHQHLELTDYRSIKTMNPRSKVLKIKCSSAELRQWTEPLAKPQTRTDPKLITDRSLHSCSTTEEPQGGENASPRIHHCFSRVDWTKEGRIFVIY